MPRRSRLKLTKRTVDALTVSDGDGLFWDRDLAGFGVRVHATGRKVYVVQSRGPSGLKRVTIACHGDISTAEARKRASVTIDRIKRGQDARPRSTRTVIDLAEQFMRVHVKVRCNASTFSQYRRVLDYHVLPTFGEMALTEVDRRDISSLQHRLRHTPVAANQVVKLLSTMFSLAEAWELIPAGNNPCRSLRLYRARPNERFLTPEEFRRVGHALSKAEADGSVWRPAIAAIRLLLFTGCRVSEILTLRWDDVDYTSRELRLRDAKTGPRMVPLTRPVAAVLNSIERVPGHPWVIAGQKPGVPLSNLKYYWYSIRAQAGTHDVRLHDLRHSYASRALALGENLPTIGKLLGHKKVATTARYAHLMRDAAKAAAARVGDSIGAHFDDHGEDIA